MGIDPLDEDDVPTAGSDSAAGGADSPAAVGWDSGADPDADRMAYNVRYRETVAADYQAAWTEALPAFREAWEEHKKKYPHPERSRPTVDADGSWHGEGDLKLTPEQNAEVDRAYQRICEIGKTVLSAMLGIEAEDPSRHLGGLDNYLKDPDRLKEKVANDVCYKGRTAEEALDNVKDAVRFTLVYTEGRYTDGVLVECTRLQASGFGRFDRQNSWEHDQYKGINSRWREPESGQLFEVQFHTQASLDAKELTHRAYERLRGKAAKDDEREELEAFQSAVSARIPIPPGATEIEDYSPREKRDG